MAAPQTHRVQPIKDRVALIESSLSEEVQQGIFIPQTRHRLFAFGKVVALGAESSERGCALGDNCVFQVNPMFEKTIRYKIDEEFVLLMHAMDLLGKLKDNLIALDSFEPLGRWVIVERRSAAMVDGIYLPENNGVSGTVNYFVVKCGPQVELDLKPGQQVFCDPNRTNPLKFLGSKEDYGFVDMSFIYGTLPPPEE